MFMVAMIVHGIQPGPDFMTATGSLPHIVMVGFFMAQLSFVIVGLLMAQHIAKITFLPIPILVPSLFLLSFIGAYSLNSRLQDLVIMLIFGLIGYIFLHFRYSVACFVIGFVLGPLAERNFERTLLLSDNGYAKFFASPTSKVIIMILVISMLWPVIKRNWKQFKQHFSKLQ